MRLFLLISRLLPLLKAQKMHNSSTLKSYIIYTLTSPPLQSHLLVEQNRKSTHIMMHSLFTRYNKERLIMSAYLLIQQIKKLLL